MIRLWNWIFGIEESQRIPVQIDGELIGYITLVDETGIYANGKMAKIVWVPNRIINLVLEK
jgi:hypothetical protein